MHDSASVSKTAVVLDKGGGTMWNTLRRHKKQVAAILCPRYFYRLDMINHNAKILRWVKSHAGSPYFSNRYELYSYLNANVLANAPIDFIEFGVFEGKSIFKWAE